MRKTYFQISREERDKIAIWRAEGCSIREVARRLKRDHSSILREIRRNAASVNKGYYLPSRAHDRAASRKQEAAQRSKMKDHVLREYVERHLKMGWSPEIIAGRIARELPGTTISHESIYRYIYEEASYLRRFLPRKHRRRWKKGHSRKHQKVHIPHRVPLSERADQVNQRIRFGHWESDTMEGRRSERPALNVIVERKSRFVQITKMPDRTARTTRLAITRRLRVMPLPVRRSVTYDNGHENTEHHKLNNKLKSRSYFCEPYRSWEKGTVENTIGLVRRFIPKEWNISILRPHFIRRIEFLLNHRPKKCLGFATPAEMFNKFGGALPP
jgi:IS30 family transposase